MSLIKDACSKRIIVDDDDAPKATAAAFSPWFCRSKLNLLVKPPFLPKFLPFFYLSNPHNCGWSKYWLSLSLVKTAQDPIFSVKLQSLPVKVLTGLIFIGPSFSPSLAMIKWSSDNKMCLLRFSPFPHFFWVFPVVILHIYIHNVISRIGNTMLLKGFFWTPKRIHKVQCQFCYGSLLDFPHNKWVLEKGECPKGQW